MQETFAHFTASNVSVKGIFTRDYSYELLWVLQNQVFQRHLDINWTVDVESGTSSLCELLR